MKSNNPFDTNPNYFEPIKELWDLKAEKRINKEANQRFREGKKYYWSDFIRQRRINTLENIAIILAMILVCLVSFWLGYCYYPIMN